jgi:cyclase
MFTELVNGVFSVDSRFVDGKNGIVLGERMALAIDGSNYEDEGAAMASFIRGHGFEPDRLALTHGHGDHILGAGPLASGDVYAHALTPIEIEKQIPRWAERWEVEEEEARRRVIRPTITYRDELRMDLGGVHVWMFPTPGHSPDGASVYVEEHRLLFAGDSVVTGIVAAIGAGNSEVLEASLYRLLEIDIDILVPGHGEALYGQDAVTDWLRWEAGYLAGVRDEVRGALDGGVAPEDVADGISYDAHIGDRLPKERNGMPKRHRSTVEKILAEEERKR